jgi:hypothetical protein
MLPKKIATSTFSAKAGQEFNSWKVRAKSVETDRQHKTDVKTKN